MSARSEKLSSKGWREDGRRLIAEARAGGVCTQCGKKLRSKYPIGDVRRRIFCSSQLYPGRCSDLFYEAHYQSWSVTKRAVMRRVKARFSGTVRCERCQRDPDLLTPGQTSYEFAHITEISAGGDPFDVVNVQLLCLPCHRRKTAAFLRRGTPSRAPPLYHTLEDFSGDVR